jgi:hypothetical protein
VTEREFVLTYVGVPLVVALGWLLWRSRYFLRSAVLYTLAVAALIAVLRLGEAARHAWDWTMRSEPALESVPPCIDSPPPPAGSKASCWT